MRRLLMGLGGFLTATLAVGQSPWARPAHGGYVQLGYHTIPTYSSLFGKAGEDLPLVRYVTERTLQLYGEYGLSRRTTAAVSVPFRMHQRGARTPELPLFIQPTSSGNLAALGNVSLAVRHQFLSGPLALGAGLRLDLPSSASQPQAGMRTGFDAFTILPSISAGQGFGKGYWLAYSGLALRTNNYNHYLSLGAEGGLSVGSFWLIVFVDAVLPFENDARPLNPTSTLTGLYENNQGWISPGLKAIWQVAPQWGFVVSGAGALWAQYVPKSPGLSAAVFFRWE